MHDSPGEIAQPDVKDWRKGETDPIPGKTMPSLAVITRDYPNTYKMMTALGPLAAKVGVGSKGVMWNAAEEVDALKEALGTVTESGVTQGMPSMATAKQAAETILMLAPETNGETAVKSWVGLERKTGLDLQHLSLRRQGERYRFDDLTAQPRKIITSPIWSGIESEERRYSPFVINIEEKVPVPHPHRAGAILSGSPLDARFRGAPAAVSAAAGYDGAGGGPCAAGSRTRRSFSTT